MGSDVAGIRCKAERDGDDYILNGTKYWITNGGIADYMSVFATVDPDAQHEGVCAFLVERDWPGVSIGRKIPKMGQRGSNTTGINFKDVRVPKANIMAPPGEGFMLAMQTFSRTRPAIGAFAVGTARSAMEYAIDYANKRRAFGTKMFPIEKLLRDARLFRIYEGTSEVQRYIVSGYVMNVYQPVMPPLEDLPIHRDMDPTEFEGDEGKTAWRCRICGYVHYGEKPPEECPYCFFPESAFKEVS